MNIAESTVLALRSLRASRLRTLLTAIGIIVGVTAMIVLVGVSDGMRTRFERSIGDTARSISVQPSNPTGAGKTENGNRQPLRERDAAYLKRNLSGQVAAVSAGRRGGGVISNGQEKLRSTITGTKGGTPALLNRRVVVGRFLTAEDEAQRARVVVVGPNVVDYLYGGDTNAALGAPLRVGRLEMRIVGVLERTNDFGDSATYLPLSTSRKVMGGTDTLTGISVLAPTSHNTGAVVGEIESTLDEFRKIFKPSARDYWTTMEDLQVRDTNRFVTLFTLFTASIAALSLLVGGIGVANIMFIAVKERTREIGIRKAIGARRTAIVKQFLAESTLLTALGGVVGVVLGVGLVLLGKVVLPGVLPEVGIPEVSVPAILVSLGAAVVIGLLAGVLPALRASRLRPIEALRHE